MKGTAHCCRASSDLPCITNGHIKRTRAISDEAILLADRIVLMRNGPGARIKEFVEVTLPRDLSRETMFHNSQYYRIRNHIMDFLVQRAAGRRP